MEWNVFYYNINRKDIVPYNIFDHPRFNYDVCNNLQKINDKDEFAHALRFNLQHYFWLKSEYEVIISAWCGGMNTNILKVDIYTQVMNNWNVFLDYVWSHKR